MYNLLHRDIERAVTPAARRLGMGLVVWSPLAGGVLTGKYNDGVPPASRGATTHWLKSALAEPSLARVRRFCDLARQAGMQPAHLALAWCLRRPEIASVITGATTVQQVEANLAGAGKRVPDDLARRLDHLFPRPSLWHRARERMSRREIPPARQN
jgi:aryl-alcohol dehydrogenase-like predicted oxidoreductase